jgi:pentatricopeptide repeat protein
MEADGVAAGAPIYNGLISAFAKRGDTARAEEWLARMHDVGANPDVASYSAIIHACAKAHDLARAEHWAEKMQQAGVDANTVTYNSLLNACARCGAADRAETWLAQMVEKGVEPGMLTYNSIINAWAKAGDIDRAEGWLGKMRQRGVAPDTVSYSTVIHACAQAKAPERADKLLQEMRANAPGGSAGAFCHNAVVQAWARSTNTAKAIEWLSAMLKERIEATPASFSGVVAGCLQVRDVHEADRWLQLMVETCKAPTATGSGGWEAVAAAWTQRGEYDRAAAVRRRVGAVAQTRCGEAAQAQARRPWDRRHA